MKVESDTTVRLTLTPDEVRLAIHDWVKKNYGGSLTIQGVNFQFESEGESDTWPRETTLADQAA